VLYKINEPKIVHETIDGETFIINTLNGLYFVVDGYANVIWNAIANGHTFEEINDAFKHAHIFSFEENHVETFFSTLLNEHLISIAEHENTKPSKAFVVEKNANFQAPILAKYDDLKELVSLDPIHEISPDMGWPFKNQSILA
jgi:hypothetical protein